MAILDYYKDVSTAIDYYLSDVKTSKIGGIKTIELEDLYRIAKKLGFENQMRNTQVLAIGPFKKVEFVSMGLQNFNNETLKRIADIWIRHCKKVPGAFPGNVASLNSFETIGETIMIRYNEATFDQYIGTKRNGFSVLDLENPSYNKKVCLPISMGATTVTSDGKIPVGIRGKQKVSIAQGKAVSLPSGFLDPKEHIDHKKNLSIETLVKAELKEELKEKQLIKLEILGIIQVPDTRQPMFVIELKIPSTGEEIKQRLQKEIEMEEIDEIVFIKDNIEAVRDAGLNWTIDSMVKFAFHFAKQ